MALKRNTCTNEELALQKVKDYELHSPKSIGKFCFCEFISLLSGCSMRCHATYLPSFVGRGGAFLDDAWLLADPKMGEAPRARQEGTHEDKGEAPIKLFSNKRVCLNGVVALTVIFFPILTVDGCSWSIWRLTIKRTFSPRVRFNINRQYTDWY